MAPSGLLGSDPSSTMDGTGSMGNAAMAAADHALPPGRNPTIQQRRSDGWFWGEYRGNGRLVSAGLDDSTCTGCHASGEDEVRAFGLPPYPMGDEMGEDE